MRDDPNNSRPKSSHLCLEAAGRCSMGPLPTAEEQHFPKAEGWWVVSTPAHRRLRRSNSGPFRRPLLCQDPCRAVACRTSCETDLMAHLQDDQDVLMIDLSVSPLPPASANFARTPATSREHSAASLASTPLLKNMHVVMRMEG